MNLETERLILRPYTWAEFEDYVEYIMDRELQRMLALPIPDRKEAEEAFRWLMENREFLAVIRKDTKKAIGHICIHPSSISDPAFEDKKGASFSFAVASTERRKGWMAEALTEVIHELFETRGLDYLDAECTEENVASFGLQRKLGFQYWKTDTCPEGNLLVNILWREGGKTDVDTQS